MAAVLILAGCGNSDDGATDRTLPQTLMERMGQVGEPQSRLLADGIVSNGELESAYLVAVACIEDAGVSVTGEFLGAGDYELEYHSASEGGFTDIESVVAGCFEGNYDLVATVYAALYGPTEAEQQTGEQVFLSCLLESGVEAQTVEEALEMSQTTSEDFRLSPCLDRWSSYLREVTIARANQQ